MTAADDLLTEQLRASATSHGWPEDVAFIMNATIDMGVVTVDFPPHRQDEIFGLEFGGPGQPASPAIRHFLNRVELGEWYVQTVLENTGLI